MADERERIKQITTELATLEKDGKAHSWASIKPYRDTISKPHYKYLDTLARLLTGKEICVAIYHWSDELFIASNKSEPKYAKKYLLVLQRFANSLAQEDYEQLLELAVRKIYSLKVKETATSRRQKFRGEPTNWPLLVDFQKLIINYKKEYKKYKAKGEIMPNRSVSLAQIQEQAQQLFQGIRRLVEEKVTAKTYLTRGEIEEEERAEYEKKSKYNENNDWEYLSLIEDTNIITNAIYEQKLDKSLLATIKKETNIQYVDESVEEEGVHAEMKILATLHTRGKLSKRGGYIGITKLCCTPCQITLNIVNQGRLNFLSRLDWPILANLFNKLGLSPFQVCGTHGSTYMNWMVPNNIPDRYKAQLLSELEKLLLPKKVGESTSVIPPLLTKSHYRELEQEVEYESQVEVGASLPVND